MNKFTKLFVAAALLMTASCVTDATDDLGVELGKDGGQTLISLSLEESRTHINGKDGEEYPLYWSAGDVIAVNGIASEPLADASHGASAAQFTINATIDFPRNIVYPAPAEGVVAAEGLQAVTFPATQQYIAGTFAEGSAPMYAYVAESGAAVELHHLAGILRLAPKGEAVITSMSIASASGKIAGNFDLDCTSGTLTAQEDATSTITVNFGEGLALGAEATPIYVAVPAGDYGIFTITLNTASEKMVVKFDSSAKPVKAGIVREFGEFEFKATAEEGEEFLIESKEDLIRFAEIAAKFAPCKVARLAAVVDMTGEEWTPIEGFGEYIFDGGKDKGYYIKGLSAPLFGSTSATIRNLKLSDINMVSNGRLIMGAIACTMTSAGRVTKASISDCEVDGAIVINNADFTPTSSHANKANAINYGGLLGTMAGVDMTNCVNRASITISQMTTAGSTININPCIGGVAGYVVGTTLADETAATCSATDSTNDAPITYACTAHSSDNARVIRPHIGGFMGCCVEGSDTILTNCQNSENGDITLNSNFYGKGGASGGMTTGGIVGYFYAPSINNCDNYGDITIEGNLKAIALGGIGGYITYCSTELCDNYGALEIKENTRLRGLCVGGIGGLLYGTNNADYGFKNCTNNAPIKVLASAEEDFAASTTDDGAYYYRIGGITGFGRVPAANCTNNAEGDITVSGNIKIACLSEWKEEAFIVAGCIAFKTNGTPSGVWENYGDITVDATISHDNEEYANLHPIVVSGVFGPQPGNPKEGYNYGNITYNGKYEGTSTIVEIGGVYAGGNEANKYNNKTALTSKNTGNITVGEQAVTASSLYVGGIISKTESAVAITSAVNEGNISVKSSVGGDLYIGGLYGSSTLAPNNSSNSGVVEVADGVTVTGRLYAGGIFGHYTGTTALSDITNSGNVNTEGDVTGKFCAAGIGVYGCSADLTNVVNTGNIVSTGAYSADTNVGGIIAELIVGNSGVLTSVSNGVLGNDGKPVDGKGKVVLAGTYSGQVSCGGITGGHSYNYRPGSLDDVHNYGDIELSGTFKGKNYIGGISMASPAKGKTITNCSSEGDIIISGKTTGGILYASGFAYIADQAYTITNFQNKGNIIATESSQFNNDVQLMGWGYRVASITLDGCSTSRNIIHNGTQTKGKICLAGIGGERLGAITFKNGFVNSGNLSFGGTSTSTSAIHISGLGQVYGTAQKFGGELKNTGEISFTGTSAGNVYIGGLFSHVPASVTTVVATDTNSFTNVGNIKVTGTVSSGKVIYAAGIAGQSLSSITGARCYCTVDTTEACNSGWITGSPRANGTVVATNCHIGGKYIKYDEEDESATAVAIPIGSYFDYIYGSRSGTDWTGTNNHDGCGYLTSIYADPQYE